MRGEPLWALNGDLKGNKVFGNLNLCDDQMEFLNKINAMLKKISNFSKAIRQICIRSRETHTPDGKVM